MNSELNQQRKQMLIELISDKQYKPLKLKELGILIGTTKSERNDLKELLDQLVKENVIKLSNNGRYEKADDNVYTGIYAGHMKGFGFVAVEELDNDIFVSEDKTGGAFHGDTVQVRLLREATDAKRAEGEIISIVSRGITEVVGTYEKGKNFGFVIPDNFKFSKDIFIPKERSKGAVTGHKVVVKIVNYGNVSKNPEGIVTEILGHVNDPGTDIISIVRAYGIPEEFPPEVMKQIENIPEKVSKEEMIGRKDLRHLQTVTIDGEDAKDLDDAITIEAKGDNYILGVHIADVSHYVQEHSPLDKEALKRGTSVYLVDRVIPMLPHKLSNGICSLNQGQDRLALSCLMEINPKGVVVGHEIAETLICVDRRMSYTHVHQVLVGEDKELLEEYADFIPMFKRMETLSKILRDKRKVRGGIDFDFPESKIILDEKGQPIDIHPYQRNSATKIIEDFMLAANETIAEDFFWQEIPFLYRTHETPDLERIQKLSLLIQRFGYFIKVGKDEVHPKELQKLLGKIQDTPEEPMISRLALRSMKQARYTTENFGHFGLAVKYYSHFTSPIRRYPDLQIHRIIKENLQGRLNQNRLDHYKHILGDVATATSTTERRAEEAEREVVKLKKVAYMEKFIGQTFEGVISGMTNWGIYVELENTCEGMIRLQYMNDDYYAYDEEKMVMVGEQTGRTFGLGDKVNIVVTGADKLMRTVDFKLAED